MKKMMREENLLKISEMADRSVTEASVANVLLCYMLYRMETPMDGELLYDIAVTGGIINYFTYQDAMQSLQSNGSITVSENEKKETIYTLTEKGVACAEKLKDFAAKSYRDNIVLAAHRAVKRRKNQDQVQISYEELAQGCYLQVRMMDHALTLMNLTLFAPDRRQAELLGDRILSNPSAFYHDVMQTAMENEEEPLDLSDN
jgi:hypothetical protein